MFSVEYVSHPSREVPWGVFDWLGYFGGGSMGATLITIMPFSTILSILAATIMKRLGIRLFNIFEAYQNHPSEIVKRKSQFFIIHLLVLTAAVAGVLSALVSVLPYSSWFLELLAFLWTEKFFY